MTKNSIKELFAKEFAEALKRQQKVTTPEQRNRVIPVHTDAVVVLIKRSRK